VRKDKSIASGVISTIGVNATLLNLGVLVLCGWFVATKQDIPNLLLGALIANSGSALGSLSSVLNSTRSSSDAAQAVQVVNEPDQPVPVDPA
jgi:hypothetical protein